MNELVRFQVKRTRVRHMTNEIIEKVENEILRVNESGNTVGLEQLLDQLESKRVTLAELDLNIEQKLEDQKQFIEEVGENESWRERLIKYKTKITSLLTRATLGQKLLITPKSEHFFTIKNEPFSISHAKSDYASLCTLGKIKTEEDSNCDEEIILNKVEPSCIVARQPETENLNYYNSPLFNLSQSHRPNIPHSAAEDIRLLMAKNIANSSENAIQSSYKTSSSITESNNVSVESMLTECNAESSSKVSKNIVSCGNLTKTILSNGDTVENIVSSPGSTPNDKLITNGIRVTLTKGMDKTMNLNKTIAKVPDSIENSIVQNKLLCSEEKSYQLPNSESATMSHYISTENQLRHSGGTESIISLKENKIPLVDSDEWKVSLIPATRDNSVTWYKNNFKPQHNLVIYKTISSSPTKPCTMFVESKLKTVSSRSCTVTPSQLQGTVKKLMVFLKSSIPQNYSVPLALGWIREVTYWKNSTSGKTVVKVYYHTPGPKSLPIFSSKDLARYLTENKINNSKVGDFYFCKEPISKPPWEILSVVRNINDCKINEVKVNSKCTLKTDLKKTCSARIKLKRIFPWEDAPESRYKRKRKKKTILKCKICGIKFLRTTQFVKHALNIHLEANPFKCQVCNFSTNIYHSFILHVLLHSSTESFTWSINLNEHWLRETQEKMFPCNICYKYFRKSPDLKVHYRTHISKTINKCQLNPNKRAS